MKLKKNNLNVEKFIKLCLIKNNNYENSLKNVTETFFKFKKILTVIYKYNQLKKFILFLGFENYQKRGNIKYKANNFFVNETLSYKKIFLSKNLYKNLYLKNKKPDLVIICNEKKYYKNYILNFKKQQIPIISIEDLISFKFINARNNFNNIFKILLNTMFKGKKEMSKKKYYYKKNVHKKK